MRLYILLIIILLCSNFNCIPFNDGMKGHVYDADTQDPVDGAQVNMYFNCNFGELQSGVQTGCGKPDDSDLTDHHGRFYVEIVESVMAGDNHANGIEISKEGYITYYGAFHRDKKISITVYLKKL